jgi:hypothetical protein
MNSAVFWDVTPCGSCDNLYLQQPHGVTVNGISFALSSKLRHNGPWPLIQRSFLIDGSPSHYCSVAHRSSCFAQRNVIRPSFILLFRGPWPQLLRATEHNLACPRLIVPWPIAPAAGRYAQRNVTTSK